jgi:hypothetical protein
MGWPADFGGILERLSPLHRQTDFVLPDDSGLFQALPPLSPLPTPILATCPDPCVGVNLRLKALVVLEESRLDRLNFDAYIYVYNVAEGINFPTNGVKLSAEAVPAWNGPHTTRKQRFTRSLSMLQTSNPRRPPRSIRCMNIAERNRS